jgi:hypothetical protein
MVSKKKSSPKNETGFSAKISKSKSKIKIKKKPKSTSKWASMSRSFLFQSMAQTSLP